VLLWELQLLYQPEILKTVANWKSDAIWEYMRAVRASSMRISELMGLGQLYHHRWEVQRVREGREDKEGRTHMIVILTKSELHHMWMTGLLSHGRFLFRIFLSRQHYV
jgi:hypothetical protein